MEGNGNTGAPAMAQWVKNLAAMQETQFRSLGLEDPLEKEMVTYSSILAWKIQWTEEPGELKSKVLQIFRHDWETEQRAERMEILPWSAIWKFPQDLLDW